MPARRARDARLAAAPEGLYEAWMAARPGEVGPRPAPIRW
jgi:hypothetical protein